MLRIGYTDSLHSNEEWFSDIWPFIILSVELVGAGVPTLGSSDCGTYAAHILVFVIYTYYYICYNEIVEGNRMKSYSSRGSSSFSSNEVNVVGSHHQYKHPTKPGRVTVKHPDKDIPPKTLKNIEKQAGLLFE